VIYAFSTLLTFLQRGFCASAVRLARGPDFGRGQADCDQPARWPPPAEARCPNQSLSVQPTAKAGLEAGLVDAETVGGD